MIKSQKSKFGRKNWLFLSVYSFWGFSRMEGLTRDGTFIITNEVAHLDLKVDHFMCDKLRENGVWLIMGFPSFSKNSYQDYPPKRRVSHAVDPARMTFVAKTDYKSVNKPG